MRHEVTKMDDLTLIQSINEAIEMLRKARADVAGGSLAIWSLIDDAQRHLDKQIADLLKA